MKIQIKIKSIILSAGQIKGFISIFMNKETTETSTVTSTSVLTTSSSPGN
jgi:hypothetical protein